MTAFRKGVAALLCVALCMGAGCAAAGEVYGQTEYEARRERLDRFVTVIYPNWAEEDGSDFAYVTAKMYEGEKLDTPRDYSVVEQLELRDFTQAQFEEILPQAPGLRFLDLAGCEVEDISPLLGVPSLVWLTLDWSGNLPRQLETLAERPKPLDLELNGVPADADLAVLTALPELDKLDLSFQDGTLCDLLPLAALPGLRSLVLDGVSADADLSPLAALPGLEKLVLDSVSADTDLSPLAALTGLDELKIRVVEESDAGVCLVQALPELPELRSLTIFGKHDGVGTVIPSLPDLPALEVFSTNANMDPALFAHMPALRDLRFAGGDDFGPLSALTALETLCVLRFLPDDLSPLYGLPALNSLLLYGHDIDTTDYVDQLEALHEALPGLPIVEEHCC